MALEQTMYEQGNPSDGTQPEGLADYAIKQVKRAVRGIGAAWKVVTNRPSRQKQQA